MTKKNNAKKVEAPTAEEVIEEVLAAPDLKEVFAPHPYTAVSIIPRIVNGKTRYEVVSLEFSENGTCGKPKVLFSEIKESTAITRLMQAAHEELDIKVLRDNLREQRKEKNGK